MKNGDNTKGKITITTNKASVLNASTINNQFASINKKYIKQGNLVALEGWYRTYLLFKKSGKSARAFATDASSGSDWTADSIRNRVGHIEWALANINKEGKSEVMFLNGDKFVSVVDSMEQIVVTRFPKQKTSEKNKAKSARVVSVKTIDENECRKRIRNANLSTKLSKSDIDALVIALMQEEVK